MARSLTQQGRSRDRLGRGRILGGQHVIGHPYAVGFELAELFSQCAGGRRIEPLSVIQRQERSPLTNSMRPLRADVTDVLPFRLDAMKTLLPDLLSADSLSMKNTRLPFAFTKRPGATRSMLPRFS